MTQHTRNHPGLLAALAVLLIAEACSGGDAERAVIRMPSHGASATVIFTEPGRSYVLSCAHAFEGGDRFKPIKLDGADAPRGPATIVALDEDLDLSLIEVPNGPVRYAAAVYGRTYRVSQSIVSVGFDEMKLPAVRKPAHILSSTRDVTWTREPPWHGRSGGGLIDTANDQLIGVVSGYVTYPHGPGVYSSHAAICRFLEKAKWKTNGQREKEQGQRAKSRTLSPFPFPPLPFPHSPFPCPT